MKYNHNQYLNSLRRGINSRKERAQIALNHAKKYKKENNTPWVLRWMRLYHSTMANLKEDYLYLEKQENKN